MIRPTYRAVLDCDMPLCFNDTQVTVPNGAILTTAAVEAYVREQASHEGWRYLRGKDVCWKHGHEAVRQEAYLKEIHKR